MELNFSLTGLKEFSNSSNTATETFKWTNEIAGLIQIIFSPIYYIAHVLSFALTIL